MLKDLNSNKQVFSRINFLHILNDGYLAGLLILLPFIAKELQINFTLVGIMGSAVNLFQIIMALPAGYLAAKFGGLRVLISALLIYSLGFLLSGLAFSYYFVIVAFIIGGVGFSLFHPIAFAVVAGTSGKENRGKELGNFTAVGDIGRIIIPSLMTVIITYIGWRQTSLINFFILFIVFVVFLKFISRTNESVVSKQPEKDQNSYLQVFKNKRFILATMSYSLDMLVSTSLFVFIPFILLKRGVTPALLGLFTATFFIGNMFGKTLLGRLVDKYESAKIFIISEIAMVIFIIIFANSTSLPVVALAAVALGIFTKGTVPILTAMVSESVEHFGRFEKAFGLNAFTTGITTTLSPLLLGYLSDKYGIVNAFNISTLFALSAIFPALIFRKLKRSF